MPACQPIPTAELIPLIAVLRHATRPPPLKQVTNAKMPPTLEGPEMVAGGSMRRFRVDREEYGLESF